MDPTIKDFEAAIAELESIVKKLEEAERRIEILNERGQLRPAPEAFGEDDETKSKVKS
jgi:hypothetical protein